MVTRSQHNALAAMQSPPQVTAESEPHNPNMTEQTSLLGQGSLASESSPSTQAAASPASRERASSADKERSRKLLKNREAAVKSRQRHKQDAQRTKDEVKRLKVQVEQLQREVEQLQGQLELEKQEKSARLAIQAAAMLPSTSSAHLRPAFDTPHTNSYQPAGPSTAWQAGASTAWSAGLSTAWSREPAVSGLPIALAGPSGLPSHDDQLLQDIRTWHIEHAMKAVALLNVRHEGVSLPVLEHHVNDVYRHLRSLFHMKAAALQGSTARAVLSLQHLPEYQQQFSPLGILSCSAVCAGILAKLAPSLQSHQHSILTQLQASLAQQEAALHVLLDGTVSEVIQHMANFQTEPARWDFMQAKLHLMTDVFQAADILWERFLSEAENCLSMPQLAVVITGLAETAAALGEVWHNHQPAMQNGTGRWERSIPVTLEAANASTRAMSLP